MLTLFLAPSAHRKKDTPAYSGLGLSPLLCARLHSLASLCPPLMCPLEAPWLPACFPKHSKPALHTLFPLLGLLSGGALSARLLTTQVSLLKRCLRRGPFLAALSKPRAAPSLTPLFLLQHLSLSEIILQAHNPIPKSIKL